jgi:hypothetical protein
MGNITDNSLSILRYLNKALLKGTEQVKRGEVKKAVKLSEQEFDAADQYLLQSGLASGTFGGDDGSMWLTSKGITYLEEAEKSATFWKRNKDEILVGLITAVIGYVLGYLSALLVR